MLCDMDSAQHHDHTMSIVKHIGSNIMQSDAILSREAGQHLCGHGWSKLKGNHGEKPVRGCKKCYTGVKVHHPVGLYI